MLNQAEGRQGMPAEETQDEGGGGHSIVISCHEDGTYDVFSGPSQPATEADHPDGLFGLETLEEALKAVIALKGQGADYRSVEHTDMMSEFEGNEAPKQGAY